MQIAIWDYNNCFDNYPWFTQDFQEFILQENSWFSRLLQDRVFVDKVVERYRELREGTLSEEYLYQRIDACVEELGEAKERNFAVWGYTFYGKLLVEDDDIPRNPTNYEEAIEQLKSSIHTRLSFLDEHITDLYQGCVN